MNLQRSIALSSILTALFLSICIAIQDAKASDNLDKKNFNKESTIQKTSKTDSCQVARSRVENSICGSKELRALDKKLSNIYSIALNKAGKNESYLIREQSGWVKGKDECWKHDDIYTCIEQEYLRRIAYLQAKYQLVPSIGPLFFACEGNSANEIVLTYFHTNPRTLVTEKGDSVYFMYLATIDPYRYQGRNEYVEERNTELLVSLGYEKPEERCIAKP